MIVMSYRLFPLNRLLCYCFINCFQVFYFVHAEDTNKYDSLYHLIVQSESNQPMLKRQLQVYLSEAKLDGNQEEIVYAYRNFMHYLGGELGVVYADSMIYAAQQTNDYAVLGSAYLSKGIFFYGLKDPIQALNAYLEAQNYLSQTTNLYLQHKVNYNIGNIQYYLGSYEEAIDLFKECISYFEIEHPRAYLNSLHSLALCHTRMGNIGLSDEIVAKGLMEGERLGIDKMAVYFVHLQGINHYFKNNFGLALDKLLSVLPLLDSNNDFANFSIGNFYVGKSYWQLQNRKEALFHFKKVDEIFTEKNYIRDDLRAIYELLILHAKERKNLEEELYYLQQLIRADSVLEKQYRQVSQKLHRDYDHQKLRSEKEVIQKQLDNKRKSARILVYVVSFLSVLLLSFLLLHFYTRQLYKKRYRQWKNKGVNNPHPISKISLTNENVLVPERSLVSILTQLDQFEKDHKFTNKDLTLSKLASAFDTNPKYLSLAIKHSRRVSFTEYINSLKVDYFIEKLKSNRLLRNYTHKAMADEAGFSSTPRFTSAFKKHTGISLSFYIQQIKEEGCSQ